MPADTIFALATAPGRAAVAVVRVSGPGTQQALRALVGRTPSPRRASLRALAGIDQALVLWFPGPDSYTGEDSAEFHLHGGRAVVEALLIALAEQGLRSAEPGEFTRRAFENDKLDLAQAEAVADLIDAETTAQAKQALEQLGGALSRRHEAWRARLIEALALLEANVDFPDEDLPADLIAQAGPPIQALRAELDAALADAARGERVREGYRIVLTGPPNAGKSSLLNALTGRDAAIVTPIPGTTRDVIEVPMTLAGRRVLLADTAGLRQATDEVEAEGVRRALAWAQSADLRLHVIDGAAPVFIDAGPDDVAVMTKADLNPVETPRVLSVSALSGQGLAALRVELETRVVAALSGAEFPAATRQRHLRLLSEARDHLARAYAALGGSPELAAEDCRLAARALGRITGRIDPEDILDQVFGQFCIGK